MSGSALPPKVEVARILLWVQASVLLLGLLALMLWVQSTAPPHGLSAETSAAVWMVIGTVVGAAALLAIAARQVRLGRVVGWVLALLAQVAVVSLPAHAWTLGVDYGAGALVLLVVALAVGGWLLSPDVIRFFVRRPRAPLTSSRTRTGPG